MVCKYSGEAFKYILLLAPFKNLWKAGTNASLTIKSNAGKAQVNLSVELGNPFDCDHPQHVNLRHGSKNGPAWQRRRFKRAAAHETAEAVTEHVVVVKATADGNVAAEKAVTEHNIAVATEDRSTTEKVSESVVDEFCSDEEYSREVEESS